MATMTTLACRFSLAVTLGFGATFNTLADQVIMHNGDHYHGKVLSVSPTNVVLQSEVLGVLKLARSQVANVAMGVTASSNAVPAVSPAKTNAPSDLSAAVRQLSAQSNLVNQVRAQLLTTANPEANQKFDQMLNDLGTGKMSVADLRAEAKAAAAQLREFEQEAGDDASGTVGLYLSILDGFLAETETPTGAVTNRAAPQTKP